jgi:hypothetical protein
LFSNTNFIVKADHRLIIEAKNCFNFKKALAQAEKHYEDFKQGTFKELNYLIVLNAYKLESEEIDNEIIIKAKELADRVDMRLNIIIIKGRTFMGKNINNANSISKQLSECCFDLKNYITENKDELFEYIAKYFVKEFGQEIKEKLENSGFSSN